MSDPRSSSSDFTGQTVMITGAAGNLGRAVVNAFADRGASLALLVRDVDKARTVFGDESERRAFFAADLLDAGAVAAAVAALVARNGRIDVLCNLAGGFRMGDPVHLTSDDDWDFLLDINARTLLHVVRAVVPVMLGEAADRRPGGSPDPAERPGATAAAKRGSRATSRPAARSGGKIVNVGAASAQKGAAMMGAYVAAKSAVIRITETMAAELRARDINVNCVLPTIIDTPENRKAMPDADPSKWVAPEDLANVIVFLASPAAKAIHGAAIPVSGLS